MKKGLLDKLPALYLRFFILATTCLCLPAEDKKLQAIVWLTTALSQKRKNFLILNSKAIYSGFTISWNAFLYKFVCRSRP